MLGISVDAQWPSSRDAQCSQSDTCSPKTQAVSHFEKHKKLDEIARQHRKTNSNEWEDSMQFSLNEPASSQWE